MKRTLAAAAIALTILTTGCSSGPTLTDAQLLWCLDNHTAVVHTQTRLGLMHYMTIAAENAGVVTINDGGAAQPSDELDAYNALVKALQDNPDPNVFWDWTAEKYDESLEHPDGIRACIAAYDFR